jgi:hypothetical protein
MCQVSKWDDWDNKPGYSLTATIQGGGIDKPSACHSVFIGPRKEAWHQPLHQQTGTCLWPRGNEQSPLSPPEGLREGGSIR